MTESSFKPNLFILIESDEKGNENTANTKLILINKKYAAILDIR